MIRESCSCGASIEISGYSYSHDETNEAARFRSDHQHVEPVKVLEFGTSESVRVESLDRRALYDIAEALYPDGDREFEWDASTIERVAEVVTAWLDAP